jgi:serine/threonine-protein kinase
MSRVYAARHPTIGNKVAIKVLVRHCPEVPGVARQLVEEARAASRIGHPGIVEVLSLGQLPDGRPFMVMELLEGETLEQRKRRGRIPPLELRRLVTGICGAVDATHRAGVVHRDLKPENIFINRAGTAGARVKLLDFGAARLLDGGGGRGSGAVGTPAFMAPEQWLDEPVDHRADIYALGVILYWLFSGKLPFRAPTLAAVLRQHTSERPAPPSRYRRVPTAVESLILACLEKDPARRPSDALGVASRLDAALSQGGSRRQPPGRCASQCGPHRLRLA